MGCAPPSLRKGLRARGQGRPAEASRSSSRPGLEPPLRMVNFVALAHRVYCPPEQVKPISLRDFSAHGTGMKLMSKFLLADQDAVTSLGSRRGRRVVRATWWGRRLRAAGDSPVVSPASLSGNVRWLLLGGRIDCGHNSTGWAKRKGKCIDGAGARGPSACGAPLTSQAAAAPVGLPSNARLTQALAQSDRKGSSVIGIQTAAS